MSGTTAPAGTLTFTSNGKTLGTAALTETGSASLTTTELPAGSDSIQATYSGDSNYQASASPELTMAVSGVVLDATPTSATVKGGEAATFHLSATPKNGYSEAVRFSCSGLPAGSSCTLSPAMVAMVATARGPASSTLTISTAPLTAFGTGVKRDANPWMLLGGGLAAALLIAPLRRRRAWPAFALALTLIGALAATGCASSSDPPAPQTYAATVTAQGRSASQSMVLNLTITG